jgi:ATP-binding cassette subfamily F protein 3
MIISHDREFLRNTCDFTLEVDQGDTFLFSGKIDEYMEYKNQKIDSSIKQNIKIDKQQKHMQKFVDRFGAKASLAKSAKSKERAINKLEDNKINIKTDLSVIKIKIPNIEEKKGLILKTKDLKIGYKEKDVASDINLEFESGKKIAILGDNGEGKSTFLKTVSDRLEPKDGYLKWRNNIKIDYYAQDIINGLNSSETVENFLRRNSERTDKSDIYKMASNFLFKENDLNKSISILSGGEKSRLCLAGLLLTDNEVLLLDEPTNHLDFETAEALGDALKECNKTIFFISHDRYFISQIATDIVEVKNKKIVHSKRNYEDYLYFLKLNLLENDNNKSNIKNNTQEVETKKDNNNQEIREYTKDRSKIESENKEIEKEKNEILMEFSKNINQEKMIKLSKRLKMVDSLLDDNEEKLLKIEEKIDELKK